MSLRREEGQAIVELVLALTLLLMLGLGMVDVGRVLHAYSTSAQASREGARVAALGYDDGTVLSAVNDSLSGFFNVDKVQVSIVPEDDKRQRGEPITVKVQIPVSILFPGYGVFAEDPLQVVGKTVMRME